MASACSVCSGGTASSIRRLGMVVPFLAVAARWSSWVPGSLSRDWRAGPSVGLCLAAPAVRCCRLWWLSYSSLVLRARVGEAGMMCSLCQGEVLTRACSGLRDQLSLALGERLPCLTVRRRRAKVRGLWLCSTSKEGFAAFLVRCPALFKPPLSSSYICGAPCALCPWRLCVAVIYFC